jgi:hypothetical protein
MKLRRTALLVAGLVLAASAARAETLRVESDLKPFADKVMSTTVNSGLKAGFAVMRPYLVIPEAELQNVLVRSIAQREETAARYGGRKKLGDSLVRLTYIEKTERQALPWMFHFYQTRNGWVLSSFLWNDRASELFNMAN